MYIMVAQLANCLNKEHDEDAPDGECKLVVFKKQNKKTNL